jgi:hypothetical protein
MARIRRLNCFDISKIKKMISYLGDINEGEFIKALWNEILLKAQNLLPLCYSFLPESFVLVDNKEILGLITVNPTAGNPYKINISRLVFSENMFEVGKQLVEFIVARFGARGAVSFSVMLDENDDELIQLFVHGCDFRQCSKEVLWKIDTKCFSENKKYGFRFAQNSDSKYIARLFNGEIQSMYRPTLERIKEEYKEPFFAGLSPYYKNRYVLEEPSRHKIIAYLSITTSDNSNFILDLCMNDGFEFDYDEILSFAISQIKEKKSTFYLFVKQKKYSKNSEKLEEYFMTKGFSRIQSRQILIKDYYKPIKQNDGVQVFLFGEKLMNSN